MEANGNQNKIYERLRMYVDDQNICRKTMALNMGVSESKLSLMLNGKRKMTVDEFVTACKAISVSPVRFLNI